MFTLIFICTYILYTLNPFIFEKEDILLINLNQFISTLLEEGHLQLLSWRLRTLKKSV